MLEPAPIGSLDELPTDDLINELRRRKRLALLSLDQIYYAELKDDDQYMQHMEDQIVRFIAHRLHSTGLIDFTDRDAERAAPHFRRIRTGQIEVVISQEDSDVILEAVSRLQRAGGEDQPGDDAVAGLCPQSDGSSLAGQ